MIQKIENKISKKDIFNMNCINLANFPVVQQTAIGEGFNKIMVLYGNNKKNFEILYGDKTCGYRKTFLYSVWVLEFDEHNFLAVVSTRGTEYYLVMPDDWEYKDFQEARQSKELIDVVGKFLNCAYNDILGNGLNK